jgi:hypothetical protein
VVNWILCVVERAILSVKQLFTITWIKKDTHPCVHPVFTDTQEIYRMPNRNASTVGSYHGAVEQFLTKFRCHEMSEITQDQLHQYCRDNKATFKQKAILFSLWTGGTEVPKGLSDIIAEIGWPKERERMIRVLSGKYYDARIDEPNPALEALVERAAWK